MKRGTKTAAAREAAQARPPRQSERDRRPALSRERDPLTPAEKERAVRILAPRIYPGKAESARVLASGSLGSKDSAHDVFFAHNDDHPQGGVAIKRFRRPGSARQELDAIRKAQERGFMTLEPVGDGLFSLDDMGTALVTARVPNFTTMNQIGWQNFYAGEAGYDDIVGTLRNISGFIGLMHSRGVVHHDPQMKNFGQTARGDFLAFDLEDAAFFDPGAPDHDEYFFQDSCAADLSDMVQSLVAHGFLSHSNDHILQEELTAHVLGAYIEVNPSDHVLDSWDGIMAEVIRTRQHGARMAVGAAAGAVATDALVGAGA